MLGATLDAGARGAEQGAQLHTCISDLTQQGRKLLQLSGRSWIAGFGQVLDLPFQSQTVHVERQHMGIPIHDPLQGALRRAVRHRVFDGQGRDERLRPPTKMIGAT